MSPEIDNNIVDENETYSEIHRESIETVQSPNDSTTTSTLSTIYKSPKDYELPRNYSRIV